MHQCISCSLQEWLSSEHRSITSFVCSSSSTGSSGSTHRCSLDLACLHTSSKNQSNSAKYISIIRSYVQREHLNFNYEINENVPIMQSAMQFRYSPWIHLLVNLRAVCQKLILSCSLNSLSGWTDQLITAAMFMCGTEVDKHQTSTNLYRICD
jgi:hypothetical protein